MKLKELKEFINKFPDGTVLLYGISEPFAWRGYYDEVAFAICGIMLKEDILKNIELAYLKEFRGWKGGYFKYCDDTVVNFEEDYSSYSKGKYCKSYIKKIKRQLLEATQEETLIKLAFQPITHNETR